LKISLNAQAAKLPLAKVKDTILTEAQIPITAIYCCPLLDIFNPTVIIVDQKSCKLLSYSDGTIRQSSDLGETWNLFAKRDSKVSEHIA
jgi:hypothetical protein